MFVFEDKVCMNYFQGDKTRGPLMPRKEGTWTSKIKSIDGFVFDFSTPRKLILFIVSCGLFLILIGCILLVLYSVYHGENKNIRPAIVIGEIFIIFVIIIQ